MKLFFRLVLAAYLLLLLWLLLFKLSYDFSAVLNHQERSLNIVPFAGFSSSTREMRDNFLVFLPLGLLMSVSLKQLSFRQKLIGIFLLSVAVELVQFILAIGVTDITDIITNTLGGGLGLVLYGFARKFISSKYLDWFIAVVIACLLTAFLLLRVLVFKVRY